MTTCTRVRVQATGIILQGGQRYEAGDTFVCSEADALALQRSIRILERLPEAPPPPPVIQPVTPVPKEEAAELATDDPERLDESEPRHRMQPGARDRMMRLARHRG